MGLWLHQGWLEGSRGWRPSRLGVGLESAKLQRAIIVGGMSLSALRHDLSGSACLSVLFKSQGIWPCSQRTGGDVSQLALCLFVKKKRDIMILYVSLWRAPDHHQCQHDQHAGQRTHHHHHHHHHDQRDLTLTIIITMIIFPDHHHDPDTVMHSSSSSSSSPSSPSS